MSDIDIDKLESLARTATPGPWSTEILGPADEDWPEAMAIAATVGRQKIFARAGSDYPRANQQYIAAVSPDVVLALIDRLRKAEGELAALATDAADMAAEMDEEARKVAR